MELRGVLFSDASAFMLSKMTDIVIMVVMSVAIFFLGRSEPMLGCTAKPAVSGWFRNAAAAILFLFLMFEAWFAVRSPALTIVAHLLCCYVALRMLAHIRVGSDTDN